MNEFAVMVNGDERRHSLHQGHEFASAKGFGFSCVAALTKESTQKLDLPPIFPISSYSKK